MINRLSIGILLVALGAVNLASAQQPPAMTQQTQNIKRTPLQKFEVPGTNFETVIGIAEIVPNVSIGRHTHPGPESAYMLEGEMVLMVQGTRRTIGADPDPRGWQVQDTVVTRRPGPGCP